jgi:hypothetical protein
VAGGLHGEGAVKGLLLPWLVLEVAAVQLAQVLQALLLVVFVADVHLHRITGKGGELVLFRWRLMGVDLNCSDGLD